MLQIRLDNRKELIEWLIDIHNQVNRDSGKKIYSYDEVYQLYNDMYGVTNERGNYDYLFLLLILSIIIGSCYYYKEFYLKKN